jgi:hypothetical protein
MTGPNPFKPRHPTTWPWAIKKIHGALGLAAEEAVELSNSILNAWGDPDRRETPSIESAFRLDVAYARAGLGAPPLLEVYKQRFADATADVAHVAAAPATRMLQATAEFGELAAGLAAALGDGRLTLDEARRAQRDAVEAIEKLTALTKDIDAVLAKGGRA